MSVTICDFVRLAPSGQTVWHHSARIDEMGRLVLVWNGSADSPYVGESVERVFTSEETSVLRELLCDHRSAVRSAGRKPKS